MNWIDLVRNDYKYNYKQMAEELENDELLDAYEELGNSSLRKEIKRRGLNLPLKFEE